MLRFVAFALLAALLACTGCKKPPDDKALAQGEWDIVSVDLPEETDRGDRQDAEKLKEFTLRVQGDRVTLSHAKEKETVSANVFLDQTKTPREIDLNDIAVSDDPGNAPEAQGTARGIYQITGDEIVIALPLGDGKNLPRPTEFKPLADKANHRGVLVFHLKKRK